MEPQIQYCKTSDGVNIAYWTLGKGGEPLVITSPLAFSHITEELKFPGLRRWYERVARDRMIVRYDHRSMGMSQRGTDASYELLLLDIDGVAQALGLPRFALLAAYRFGELGIRFAATEPERVARLLIWCEGVPNPQPASILGSQGMLSLAKEDWKAFTETVAHRLFGWSKGEQAREYAKFMRASITKDDLERFFPRPPWGTWLEDVGHVACPTLVLHHTGYGQLEAWQVNDLAAGIPGARLVRIGGVFEPFFENTVAIEAIDEFLGNYEAPGSG